MMSWRIELFIIQGRGATRSKMFPRNEIAIVPGELFIIEVFLTISWGFFSLFLLQVFTTLAICTIHLALSVSTCHRCV